MESSKKATAFAKFNIVLNGFISTIEIRNTDFSTFNTCKFDHIISSHPSSLLHARFNTIANENGGIDGLNYLLSNFSMFPTLLSENGVGVLMCNALGDRFSINLNIKLGKLAKKNNLFMRAYVIDKIPIEQYIASIKTNSKSDLLAWQKELGLNKINADYVYNQIIKIWKRKPSGFSNLPIYKPVLSDPLYRTAKFSSIQLNSASI